VESKSVVALDKSNGREVWRVEGVERSWSTPLVVELPGGGRELVVSIRGRTGPPVQVPELVAPFVVEAIFVGASEDVGGAVLEHPPGRVAHLTVLKYYPPVLDPPDVLPGCPVPFIADRPYIVPRNIYRFRDQGHGRLPDEAGRAGVD